MIDIKYQLPKFVRSKGLDYSKFELNNWLDPNSTNHIWQEIHARGGAFWISNRWQYNVRRSINDQTVSTKSKSDIGQIMLQVLNKESSQYSDAKHKFSFGSFYDDKQGWVEVFATELYDVIENFTPHTLSEFYCVDNLWYRTSFVPTKYIMGVDLDPFDNIENSTIFKLIKNIVNNNNSYFAWVINWLAGFLKTLQRSQVALVLRGTQGSGKGLFFNNIVMPMFGEKYCRTVDNRALSSQFNGWITEKLMVNINEAVFDKNEHSHTYARLKQMITDEKVNSEMKYKDSCEVRSYANIIITSNASCPIEIEADDRRFTVFSTGEALRTLGWDIDKALDDIDKELSAFANFLHHYEVNWVSYHTAVNTPDKQAIIDKTTTDIARFAQAVAKKDLRFFDELYYSSNTQHVKIYKSLIQNFKVGKVEQPVLCIAYNVLFNADKTPHTFNKELALQLPSVFGKHKLKKSNKTRYFELE